MKKLKPLSAAALAAALALAVGFQAQAQKPRDEPIQPIEPAKVTDPAKVQLGKKLWFDPRLSRSGFISCNSCHNLSMGGSDNVAASVGDRWQKGGINSPTVLNAVMNIAQFWDGRAKDLADQAGGPIENPIEMNSTHADAVATLQSIPGYVEEFKSIYKVDKIMGRLQLGRTFTTEENAQIVAFLKTLTGDQPQITLPILPVSSDKTPRPDPFAPIVAPMKK